MEATRKERAWLKRLAKLVEQQPENTWVFVECDSIHLMRLDVDGEKALVSKSLSAGFDQACVVGTVLTRNWDGGAW